MLSQVFFALACATLSLAYQVTFPGGAAGWNNVGAQPLRWVRVATDRENFTAVLVNQRIQMTQVLAALVDGTTGETMLSPQNGGWPTGDNFRVNLCQDDQHLDTILAQSTEFSILAPTTSLSQSQTHLTTASTSSPVRPVTSTTAPPASVTTDIANPNQSNAAVPVGANAGVTGLLLGLLAVFAA